MTIPRTPIDYAQVADLYQRNHRAAWIAEQLGISPDLVRQRVFHARKQGLLPPAEESRASRECPTCGATLARWKRTPQR